MNKPDTQGFDAYAGLPFASLAKNPLENATGAFRGWMRYVGYLQDEAAGFVRERLRRDVGALERFARCRRPEEYIEAQANFVADLYSDYAKEAVKIAGLFGDAAQTARAEFAELGAKPADAGRGVRK